MRWLPLLLSLALPLGSFAAKKSDSTSVYEQFRTKQASAAPVKLTDASYSKLSSAPRDYAAAILLTAMDNRFGCQLCHDFQPEWELLAKSWTKGDKKGESRLIFGTLDFTDGRDTFISLGLQTAPVLLLFQPTTGPDAVASPEALRYDFTTGSPSAEQAHDWIARNLPNRPHPAVHRPIRWGLWAITIVTLLGGAAVIYKASPVILPVVQNRRVWAGISIIGILAFTSGHMFNQIRKVPYVVGNNHGGITYFAGGFQNQFGMETQIIAAIYALLAFATISLVTKVPRLADPRIQQVTVFAWCGVTYITYSLLLSIFRMKNGGYPFTLLSPF